MKFIAIIVGAAAIAATPLPQTSRGDGGLAALTEPAVMGVGNPPLTDAGKGVADAAPGTQQTADLEADAVNTLLHTVAGIASNAEQDAGVAAANIAPTVKDVSARTNRRRDDSDGLEALTEPAVMGVADPSLTDAGKAVAAAASGTQQTTDLNGDAIATLAHTLGGISSNAEQGAGVAAANIAPAAQDTADTIQHNDGLAGDVVKVLGGN